MIVGFRHGIGSTSTKVINDGANPILVRSTTSLTMSNDQDPASSGSKVIHFPEGSFNAEPQPPFDYHSLDGQDPVICIDNG